VNKRKAQGLAAFQWWLKNMAITGIPAGSSSNFPTVGVAFSVGGLRAMLSGAGVFDRLDSRLTTGNPNVNSGKPTGNGLLDFTTYITGTIFPQGV
jgi:Lysophospholipase catalytic domain